MRMSIIVPDFHDAVGFGPFHPFPMFTIYDHPADFPDRYVMRMFDADRPTPYVALADTLEQARNLRPDGADLCVPRAAQDDPVIVETWF